MLFLILLVSITSVASQNETLKIIGGNRAPIGRTPYLVSIMENLKHICGGSIITTSSILTAAHCTDERDIDTIAVRAGSNFRMFGGTIVRVSSWRVHPRYNSRTIAFDLAIFYLENFLPRNSRIQPIALFNGRLRRQKAIIAGWGSIFEDGNLADNLQITAIRIIPRRTCRRAYGRRFLRSMFCAGVMNGSKDSCQGDSGGPLVIRGRVAGVISVGEGCARRGLPGLYTRVPILKQWIRRNRFE